jgi:hypothetical protein
MGVIGSTMTDVILSSVDYYLFDQYNGHYFSSPLVFALSPLGLFKRLALMQSDIYKLKGWI